MSNGWDITRAMEVNLMCFLGGACTMALLLMWVHAQTVPSCSKRIEVAVEKAGRNIMLLPPPAN